LEDIGGKDVKAIESSNVREVIELPEETKQRLKELRALSKAAEGGDEEAKRELKEALLESSPAVITRASDVGRMAAHLLIDTAAAKDPLIKGALSARMDLLRAEIAGENPTPLESLLTERVVACWLWVEVFEAIISPQLWTGGSAQLLPLPVLRHYLHWQELAHKRYLASIRELARVRRLQSNTPGIQYNQQINIGAANGKT
jgi:hypothetical protein